MNKTWKLRMLMVLSIATVGLFFYMAFFNAAYEHPGRITYYDKCVNCHGEHGQGIQLLVPPLVHADYFESHFADIPCMILNGMNDTIVVNGKQYYQPMYPIKINEVEMANLMNFLRDSFLADNKYYPEFRSIEMKQKIKNCKGD